ESVVFLHVLIHSGDNVLFEGRKKVLVKPQKNAILVETDKGIYKPGETVKFRIVNFDEDLKVIKKEDPEHNRIAEWRNVKSRHGIVDLSFPLASEALLGEYTITVHQHMAQKTFSVDEYVLQKFEIAIEHPPFITTVDEEFQLKVCGKYTYGKPVQGKVDITFITLSQFLAVKTETLELEKTDSYIAVVGEMVEDGTGTGDSIKCFLPCRQILWVFLQQLNVFQKTSLMLQHFKWSQKLLCSPKIDSNLLYPSLFSLLWGMMEVAQQNWQLISVSSVSTANSWFCPLKGTYNLSKGDEQGSSESHTDVGESFHWLKPFYSESNSFLEIKAKNDVMPCDQEQEVQVDYILDRNKLSSKADHIDFYYLVNLQGSFSLTLTIGNDFLPDIRLLLYAVFLDGEVVADVEQFEVEKCFKHKVALDFSHKEEVPGSEVSLDLKAAPGSLCSVQAVDKSVLLKKNNTLTADTVNTFNILNSLSFLIDLLSSLFFQKLRMKLLTNTRIKKPVSCMRRDMEKKVLSGTASRVAKKKPKPRTLFPETWIWDLVSVGDDGQVSLQVAVPDTITEWNANAFCVADTGFGFSPLTTLRVFQPFFVDLSLPYSVIQGETFSLKATVFNYLKDCIQVHTTLTEIPELKVEPCPGCQFISCLCANEAKTFVWNVTATRLGEAEQGDVIATTPLQGERDTVIKPLLIKPGGDLQEKTQNAFLCAADNTVTEEFSLTLPADVLEGSGRATFSMIGDIMGPALQNLDRLLEMPFGCGEQNMVQFAPNIFILQYLNKTKQLDAEIEAKALKFLRKGYQRQLLYKHDDGSYSAFGKADNQSNTWLTAFVARSFGQASSHIYINKDHVQSALLWLQKHQLPTGCFQSVGKLFNNDLKGGVDDTISLTAYITATLVELHLENNDTMLDNALHCLKNVILDKTNLYVKALMAYVFTLTKDTEMRQQLLDMLEKETGRLLLLLASHSSDERSSSIIETVAYILLAHVSKPDLSVNEASVSKLVHWLSGQRNAFGGFASTQDTVVSLQALAQYAALIPQEMRDVRVTVKGKEASPLEFHVHKNNKLVLHQASLLEVPGMYTVQATGSGCVYVQVSISKQGTKLSEVFALDVATVPRECDGVRKQLDIHVSVSYVGDRETSNMALVEVEMLSGFIPVKSSVQVLEEIPLVKKTEIKPDEIIIYLEELGGTTLKFNISVEQDAEVQNLKTATVHVYDYYKPGE
ncbi:A2ML1 protein, partial [Indicator maculatus]|nr:A2ML1 protein [Indicator maculatus]